MRRRLVVLSLATTLLVVISFLVPLGLLVRRQAADSAKVGAEQDAQSVASLVALAMAVDNDPASVRDAVGNLPVGTIVVLPVDEVLGFPQPGQGSLVFAAAETRSTVAVDVGSGWEVALPVVGVGGVAVVDSFVSNAQLSEGVLTAWLLLAILGLVLIGAAVWVADRMGRGLTRPVEELAASAHRLAEGDLDVRVEPRDPEELREMGEAFNYLAGRLDTLLAEERENVADLSHRLRTPLTSLRLQAESLQDEGERQRMLFQVDRLERAMTQVIELARSPGSNEPSRCDLNEVVRSRADFWAVLAEEHGREFVVLLDERGPLPLQLSSEEVSVVVDILIDNVFTHTPRGTAFTLCTGQGTAGPVLESADNGPGLVDDTFVSRGASGTGSTGLGLDIVRKTAEAVGGTMELENRPEGGAVVRVRFGEASV